MATLDADLDNYTSTETNQYAPVYSMSALKYDGSIMTIEEYCAFYGIPKEQVKSFKLITHQGKAAYYNIASKSVEDGIEDLFTKEFIEELFEGMKSHIPNYKTYKREKTADNNLLVIDCADIHIGKLALVYQTGEDYNLEIAVQRVTEGFQGILNKARNFNINKILLAVGNDILHTDNAKSTTTSGTFQDSATSISESFNVALKLYTSLIDSVISEYDIDIVHSVSNHDYISGWMLARTLESWYRTSGNVRCYTNMQHRKYYQYGQNMICFSHGDGAKMQDIPMLMATESPIMWSETKYRYAYLHHIHHKQVNKFQSGKDYIGVTVEYLRSPSSSDRWHSDNGYVGAKKAVEGFIHSLNDGQIARITHYF
jgi:hypothetical protein